MLFDLFTSVFIGGILGFFVAMVIDAIFNSTKSWTKNSRNSLMFYSLTGMMLITYIWFRIN
jgi:hypothetical protein